MDGRSSQTHRTRRHARRKLSSSHTPRAIALPNTPTRRHCPMLPPISLGALTEKGWVAPSLCALLTRRLGGAAWASLLSAVHQDLTAIPPPTPQFPVAHGHAGSRGRKSLRRKCWCSCPVHCAPGRTARGRLAGAYLRDGTKQKREDHEQSAAGQEMGSEHRSAEEGRRQSGSCSYSRTTHGARNPAARKG